MSVGLSTMPPFAYQLIPICGSPPVIQSSGLALPLMLKCGSGMCGQWNSKLKNPLIASMAPPTMSRAELMGVSMADFTPSQMDDAVDLTDSHASEATVLMVSTTPPMMDEIPFQMDDAVSLMPPKMVPTASLMPSKSPLTSEVTNLTTPSMVVLIPLKTPEMVEKRVSRMGFTVSRMFCTAPMTTVATSRNTVPRSCTIGKNVSNADSAIGKTVSTSMEPMASMSGSTAGSSASNACVSMSTPAPMESNANEARGSSAAATLFLRTSSFSVHDAVAS